VQTSGGRPLVDGAVDSLAQQVSVTEVTRDLCGGVMAR
jgi:hypothetical protein